MAKRILLPSALLLLLLSSMVMMANTRVMAQDGGEGDVPTDGTTGGEGEATTDGEPPATEDTTTPTTEDTTTPTTEDTTPTTEDTSSTTSSKSSLPEGFGPGTHSTVDVTTEFREYSLEHARRMLAYCAGTDCENTNTFLSNWLTAGGYPHVVPAKSDYDPPREMEGHTFYNKYGTKNGEGYADDNYGYVVYDPADDSIIVAFRGTKTTSGWISDLKMWPKSYSFCPGEAKTTTGCVKLKTHSGFMTAYLSVRPKILKLVADLTRKYPEAKIHVTGRSLGGSMAMLCAIDMHIQYPSKIASLYTFGQPRTVSEEASTYLKRNNIPYFRVVNQQDPVPHVPQVSYLVHSGVEYWYKDGALTKLHTNPTICDTWKAGKTCSETAMKGLCNVVLLCVKKLFHFHASKQHMDGAINCTNYLKPVRRSSADGSGPTVTIDDPNAEQTPASSATEIADATKISELPDDATEKKSSSTTGVVVAVLAIVLAAGLGVAVYIKRRRGKNSPPASAAAEHASAKRKIRIDDSSAADTGTTTTTTSAVQLSPRAAGTCRPPSPRPDMARASSPRGAPTWRAQPLHADGI